MIVRFAVDPDGLACDGHSLGMLFATHQRFIRKWELFGIFVDSSLKLKESPLNEALRNMPDDIKKMWFSAIKRNRIDATVNSTEEESAPFDWSGVTSKCGLEPIKNFIDLACLDEVRAVCVGCDENTVSIYWEDYGVEAVPYNLADQAISFSDAEDLALKDIGISESVSDIWQQRFRPLSEVSKSVALVDRYAFSNLVRDYDGLTRMMVELDKDGRGVVLSVYSALPTNASVTDVFANIETVAARLSRGGIREIKIFVADDRVFSRYAHDRYLRFDRALCYLGYGIEVLGGTLTSRVCTFSFKIQTDEARKREMTIEDNCEVTRVLSIGRR